MWFQLKHFFLRYFRVSATVFGWAICFLVMMTQLLRLFSVGDIGNE